MLISQKKLAGIVVNFSRLRGGAYSQWQSTFWVYGYLATEQSRHDKLTNTNLSILIVAIWFGGEMTRNHESYSTER